MAGRRSRRSCSKPRTDGVRLSSAASPARRWLVRSETRRESSCSWRNGVGMPERLVGSRIVALHQRIAALHQQVAAEPVQAVEVLPEFLNDLYTALEALHDDLAQALTSLRLDVSWLAGRALTAPAVWRERLTSIAVTIDALHQTVRRIGTELRPNVLDARGLTAAIEWQLQEIQQRTDLTYTLQKPTQALTLDQARATSIFR